MNTRSRRSLAALVALVAAIGTFARPLPAGAWGATGHHLISRAAAESLPATLPAFLRTNDVALTIEALGTEADRQKGAGRDVDADLDPGHYLDLGDDGSIGGAVVLDALPRTRVAYDTALRAAGTNQYAAGYLPYEIADGWRRLAYDFAVWRTDRVGEAKSASPADKLWFATDRQRREAIVVHDFGYWSHFIGDGSQPLHVTVHYNGWGEGPNPAGYTTSKTTHAHFEGAFVRENATLALVEAAMTPVHACGCTIEQHVARYLHATNSEVVPFYELEKQGAFAAATPAGVAFMIARVADGASALRDFTTEAYDASAQLTVGYPAAHAVRDFEDGAAVPSRGDVGGGD